MQISREIDNHFRGIDICYGKKNEMRRQMGSKQSKIDHNINSQRLN